MYNSQLAILYIHQLIVITVLIISMFHIDIYLPYLKIYSTRKPKTPTIVKSYNLLYTPNR